MKPLKYVFQTENHLLILILENFKTKMVSDDLKLQLALELELQQV